MSLAMWLGEDRKCSVAVVGLDDYPASRGSFYLPEIGKRKAKLCV